MRLRTKLTLTLLLASLAGAALVGGLAYWMLMRDFRQSVEDRSFMHFQEDVSAYLETFGSWENASARIPFNRFVLERRVLRPGPVPPVPIRPDSMMARPPLPPFRFLLTTPGGQVLKAADDYREGDQVAASLLERGRAIYANGALAAYAIPVSEPILSEQDLSYLDAMRRALGIGIGGAVLLAAVLGLLLGRRMSTDLEKLTRATRAMRDNGELEHPVAVRSTDEIGTLANAFNHMSEALTQAHQKLHELTLRDPLTQLYNRRHFNAQASQAYEQARRYQHSLTVMVADLDHFKSINDNFSHAVGDAVLRQVAQILRDNTRTADVLARIGGEEFVILYPETSLAQAAERCETLRASIEKADWSAVHPGLRVTLSIGLCDQLLLGSVEKMLNAADTQMYEAKKAGRNRIHLAA